MPELLTGILNRDLVVVVGEVLEGHQTMALEEAEEGHHRTTA